MQLFYAPYWTRDAQGYGSESWYSHTTDQPGSSTNWAIWGGYIAAPGRYTVSASWPATSANTTAAVYQVWHAGGMTPVTANQRASSTTGPGGASFVALGTFNFKAGPAAVILTDLTPSAGKDLRIYFDAVKWEPVQPLRTFLPLVDSAK